PILQYPDFEIPFTLYTNASKKGLGAVLSQKKDGKKYVIAYVSRLTNKTEENYPITDLECLAIIWSIKHIHHYLSRPFTIVTDHAAIKWLKTSKMPKGRRARWIIELQQYHFNIEHRAGKHNANADALSCIIEIEEESLLLNYVKKQLDQLPIIRNMVQQNLQKEQQKQKDQYDEKLKKIVSYQIGDL
ncbi:930_t:CDS:2, partial [Funneliformis mosseae]